MCVGVGIGLAAVSLLLLCVFAMCATTAKVGYVASGFTFGKAPAWQRDVCACELEARESIGAALLLMACCGAAPRRGAQPSSSATRLALGPDGPAHIALLPAPACTGACLFTFIGLVAWRAFKDDEVSGSHRLTPFAHSPTARPFADTRALRPKLSHFCRSRQPTPTRLTCLPRLSFAAQRQRCGRSLERGLQHRARRHCGGRHDCLVHHQLCSELLPWQPRPRLLWNEQRSAAARQVKVHKRFRPGGDGGLTGVLPRRRILSLLLRDAPSALEESFIILMDLILRQRSTSHCCAASSAMCRQAQSELAAQSSRAARSDSQSMSRKA